MPWKLTAFLIPLLLVFACDAGNGENAEDETRDGETAMVDVDRAIVVLEPTEGNDVSGTVTFVKEGDGIRVRAQIEGLTPGKHGFHIHQWGDCSALDATSAGGHFDPTGSPHAGPTALERHVGDLGNLEAGEDGRATYDRVDRIIKLSGKHSIIGRALIVHAGEDDLTSQPTGDAGGRVACGVIGIDGPESE